MYCTFVVWLDDTDDTDNTDDTDDIVNTDGTDDTGWYRYLTIYSRR